MSASFEFSFPSPTTRSRSKRVRTTVLGDTIAFIAPATGFYIINIIGELCGTDVILLSALPFLLLIRGRRLLDPLPRMFLILGCLWLSGQILTDVIRDTPFEAFSKRWAQISVFILNFCSIYLLVIVSKRRFLLFSAGIAAQLLVGGIFYPTLVQAYSPWKFGYGQAIPWLAGLCAVFTLRYTYTGRLPAILILAAAGFFLVLAGVRASGGITILSAFIIATHGILNNRTNTRRPRPMTILFLLSLGAIIGLAVLQLWSYAAGSGILGDYELTKYRMNHKTDAFSLLLNGRGEIFTSTIAIADSPIIGHGSWAKDREYVMNGIARARSQGIQLTGNADSAELIPTHSYLTGSWVEAGLLGGIFWIWAFVVNIRALSVLVTTKDTYAPIFGPALLLFAWSILFSPFSGGFQRLLAPLCICACFYLLSFSKVYPGAKAK